MSSPKTAEQLRRIKESLKKALPKTSGFKKPSSFVTKMKKDFRNHPLYFRQGPSTSSQGSTPSATPDHRLALEEMKTLATTELVTPLDLVKTKFKNLRRNFEYIVMGNNGGGNYFISAGDILLEVVLPKNIPAPPDVPFKGKLILKREESGVRWFVKN